MQRGMRGLAVQGRLPQRLRCSFPDRSWARAVSRWKGDILAFANCSFACPRLHRLANALLPSDVAPRQLAPRGMRRGERRTTALAFTPLRKSTEQHPITHRMTTDRSHETGAMCDWLGDPNATSPHGDRTRDEFTRAWTDRHQPARASPLDHSTARPCCEESGSLAPFS